MENNEILMNEEIRKEFWNNEKEGEVAIDPSLTQATELTIDKIEQGSRNE
jgi:hypothetical protein